MKTLIILLLLNITFLFAKEPIIKVLLFEGKKQSLNTKNNFFSIQKQKLYINKKNYQIPTKGLLLNISTPIKLNQSLYTGKFEFYLTNDKLTIINLVKFEKYVAGVLSGEISYSWPDEAIKTQAVAARSYAYYYYLKNKNNKYQIKSTTSSQVFKGTYKIHPQFIKNTLATKGQIVTINKKPIQAFFTAACGGETEKASDVWQTKEKLSYLQNVRCYYCSTHPKFKWQKTFTYKNLTKILHSLLKKDERIIRISISQKTRTGRIKYLNITTNKRKFQINANKFRILLGGTKMQSLKASFKYIPQGIKISGTGYGHGVGLCQWGAKTLAEQGRTYKNILKYYYKHTKLMKIKY